MCASAKYRLSREVVLQTSEMRDPSGLTGGCVSFCVDVCKQMPQAWKTTSAPKCICGHIYTSCTCYLETLASVLLFNCDAWILWTTSECCYCFSVGLQATHQYGDNGDRPGSHLFPIKRAERVLHHCNYDLLYVYMGSFWHMCKTPVGGTMRQITAHACVCGHTSTCSVYSMCICTFPTEGRSIYSTEMGHYKCHPIIRSLGLWGAHKGPCSNFIMMGLNVWHMHCWHNNWVSLNYLIT